MSERAKFVLQKTFGYMFRSSAIERIVKEAEEKCGNNDFGNLINFCIKKIAKKTKITEYELILKILEL